MFAHRGGFRITGVITPINVFGPEKERTLLLPGSLSGNSRSRLDEAKNTAHTSLNLSLRISQLLYLVNLIVFSEVRLALSLLAESYMLKIQRSSNGQVVFTLSGQIDVEHIAELETFIRAEANAQSIVLDLKDVTLAGRDAVSFLEHCEAEGVTLRNCAAYVREWITRQRRGR